MMERILNAISLDYKKRQRKKKVGFMSFFPRFTGSDVLVLEQRSTLNSGCLT